MADRATSWPELPYPAWRDTLETVHRWTQIMGKIQLALTPPANHWWNVALEVSARGLVTQRMWYEDGWFELELDFIDDVLRLRTNDGSSQTVALAPRSVADFYAETMAALERVGVACRVWPTPVEIIDPAEAIPFQRDDLHRSYDKRYVLRFWRIVANTTRLFTRFGASYLGKSSPVQFYWGHFDLALTRFSGRRAPEIAGAGTIEREAYSHEMWSVGWWPGDARLEKPSYFAYTFPEPPGYRDAVLAVPGAYYHPTLGGFYLDYDEVRRADDPDARVLAFCERTYAAAATLGQWDRAALERARPAASPRA